MQHEIVIVGAGPGGICAGIALLKAGIDDFVIVDKADGVGGTWWHNRYPGAECDVPSHLYSFSFEPKRDWTRPYARQPEILEYMRHVVDKYGLMPYIRLSTKVEAAHWQEEAATWRLDLDGGDAVEGRMLISGVGMFNELAYPDIEGIADFQGTLFHTGDWLDDHDLAGERVAVIGTAASAVQMIPEIVDQVAHLTVYQRRPQWVLPKEDDPFTPEQVRQFVEDDEAAAAQRAGIRENLESFITFSNSEALAKAEERGLENLDVVADPEVRRRLTPSKRLSAEIAVSVGTPAWRAAAMADSAFCTLCSPNMDQLTRPCGSSPRQTRNSLPAALRSVALQREPVSCDSGCLTLGAPTRSMGDQQPWPNTSAT